MIKILLSALVLLSGLLYVVNAQPVQPSIVEHVSVTVPFTPETTPEEQYKEDIPIDLLMIVNTKEVIDHSDLDQFCLAKNIYHEARGEDLLGQLAVAQVTINRVESDRYPDTICHVVLQRKQFSWANWKKNRWSHPKGAAWEHAKQLASQFLNHGVRVQGLETALFYHADYVNPKWKDNDAVIAQIGTHVFYERAKPL